MADYSHIKSKVAQQTWSNVDHEAGGGDVEITDERLNWSAEAKVDDDGQIITRKPKVKLETDFLSILFCTKISTILVGTSLETIHKLCCQSEVGIGKY